MCTNGKMLPKKKEAYTHSYVQPTLVGWFSNRKKNKIKIRPTIAAAAVKNGNRNRSAIFCAFSQFAPSN